MQKLIKDGIVVGEFQTRAEAIVTAFELNLVHDRHSRKRNTLLPNVKIEGKDEHNAIPNGYSQNLRCSHNNALQRIEELEVSRPQGLPRRGPLDTRGRNTHLDLVQVEGRWRRL